MSRDIDGKAIPSPSSIPPDPTSSKSDAALTDELIGRIARADASALGVLYDRTSPAVFGLVIRIVGDRTIAEEVTLDVYSRVWSHAREYEVQRGSIWSWLLMLARSRAIDRLRSRAGRERDREQPLEAATAVADPASSPLESSVNSERRHVVQAALASLPAEQRLPIELAFFFGLSHGEIATRLGQPVGTVKTRIRLGLLRLRTGLQPYRDAM